MAQKITFSVSRINSSKTSSTVMYYTSVYLYNSSVFKQNYISTALTVWPDAQRHSEPKLFSGLWKDISIIQNITNWNRKKKTFPPDPEILFIHTDFQLPKQFSLTVFYQSRSLNLHFEVRLASEVQTHKGVWGWGRVKYKLGQIYVKEKPWILYPPSSQLVGALSRLVLIARQPNNNILLGTEIKEYGIHKKNNNFIPKPKTHASTFSCL